MLICQVSRAWTTFRTQPKIIYSSFIQQCFPESQLSPRGKLVSAGEACCLETKAQKMIPRVNSVGHLHPLEPKMKSKLKSSTPTSDSESEWRWLAIWEKTESNASLWACSDSDLRIFRDVIRRDCFSLTESLSTSSWLAWSGDATYTTRKSVRALAADLSIVYQI